MQTKKTIIAVILTLGMLSSAYAITADRTIPVKIELSEEVTLHSNAKATIDLSNLSEGQASIKYTGGKDLKLKVQMIKNGGVAYTYNLNNDGTYETFPITDGDGEYTIRVLENISGTKYAQSLSTKVDVTLRNEFLPFLYSNQYVNYEDSADILALSTEVSDGLTTDLQKLEAVYEYVTNNYTYDHALAKTVKSGYLPDLDAVIEGKTGICFDYAALMASLLRTQDIPCKLVVGYVESIYHAWVNVYIEDIGWVESAIYFDGEEWSLMDPTYASSIGADRQTDEHKSKDVYAQKYAY